MTLTTSYIRTQFALATGDAFKRGQRFDRWLAENNRQVAEEAWDAGWDLRVQLHGEPPIAKEFENPHRTPQPTEKKMLLTHPSDGHTALETCLDCEQPTEGES